MKICINGWNPGFDKITMNRFLREEFGYSLKEAKKSVDDILDGKELVLDVDCTKVNEVKAKLTEIGMKYSSFERIGDGS